MQLEETSRSGGNTVQSASPHETSPPASGFRESYDQIQGSFHISDRHHPSTEPTMHTSGSSNVDATGTKLDRACVSMQQADISITWLSGSVTQTEDALAPSQAQFAEIPDTLEPKSQQQSQELTSSPLKTDADFLRPKDVSTMNVSDAKGLTSEGLRNQQENTEAFQKSSDIGNKMKLEDITLPMHGSPSGHVEAQSDTFKRVADAQKKEKHCKDTSVTPKRVFTVVLDEPQDMQQNVGASMPDFKSLYLDNLISGMSEGADSESEKPSALVSAKLNEVESTGAKLRCLENSASHDKTHSEVSNSSISCDSVTEFHVSGAEAETETRFPDVKQEEMTDACHPEEGTMSTVSVCVEGSAQTGESLTETRTQLVAADTAHSTGTGHAEGEKTKEASDPELTGTKYLKVPQTCESTVPNVESESKLPASVEATENAQEQVGFMFRFYFFFLTHPLFFS